MADYSAPQIASAFWYQFVMSIEEVRYGALKRAKRCALKRVMERAQVLRYWERSSVMGALKRCGSAQALPYGALMR